MQPNIGIGKEHRDAVVRILNGVLADEYVLYTKTRNYHWNVVGSDFHELHKFFEEQYNQIDEAIDEVAERARQMGGVALGSLTEFLKVARLKEQPGRSMPAKDMLADLLGDHETLIRQLRQDLADAQDKHKDAGTADFLTGLMEEHEKMAWMLRAFMETPG